MQHNQHEAAIWRPTESTEKVKASTFLSYIGIVDDMIKPPKRAVFLLRKQPSSESNNVIMTLDIQYIFLYTTGRGKIKISPMQSFQMAMFQSGYRLSSHPQFADTELNFYIRSGHTDQ